ncbi:PREDICTED: caspase-2-like [Acropora digitifera]|uniref:caspase-2-like n=1 Tax=Acropora digitifera TaxID=70779 RepID=UPI00077A5BC7|nr:PREDICTED: caspase-2-like [Acropora digitifera]
MRSFPEEQFIMDKKHIELLRRNRERLVEDLDALSLLSYLYQEHTLSENDVDLVKAENTRFSQAEKLLDIVPKRGPQAFHTFCRALERRDEQKHLVALLKPPGSAPQGVVSSNTTEFCSNPPVDSVQGKYGGRPLSRHDKQPTAGLSTQHTSFTFPREPPKEEVARIHLAVKLLNGSRYERWFRNSDTLEAVMAFAASVSTGKLPPCQFCTNEVPRRVFDNITLSLSQAGIQSRTLLHLEEKRD